MAIVYVLLVAHFVADFLCQSDWMAVNKSKHWGALALHVYVYSNLLLVAMIGHWVVVYGADSPAFGGRDVLWWLGVNGLAHFVQDAITSRVNARLWFVEVFKSYPLPDYALVKFGSTRHWFFVAIGADQLLHYVTLFVTAGWWLQ